MGLNKAVGAAIERMDDDVSENIHHLTATEHAFDRMRFCELQELEEGAGPDAEAQRVENKSMNVLKLEPTSGVTLFERLQPTVFIHNTFHPTSDGHAAFEAIVATAVEESIRFGAPLPADPAAQDDASPGCDLSKPEDCVVDDTSAALAAQRASSNPCTDIDHYVGCVAIRIIRQLILPLAALVLGGRAFAVLAREDKWDRWLLVRAEKFGPFSWLRGMAQKGPVEQQADTAAKVPEESAPSS